MDGRGHSQAYEIGGSMSDDLSGSGPSRADQQPPSEDEREDGHWAEAGTEPADRAPYAVRLRVVLLLSLAGWALVILAILWIAGRF